MISPSNNAAFDLAHGETSGQIIGAFYAVYDELGHGFLESVYRKALVYELERRGLAVATEAPVDVWYKGTKVGHYRADAIIDEVVVVEVKAGKASDDADRRQLLNYLRATSLEVGLLLHFGPKPAFHRMIFEDRRKGAGRSAPS